MVTTKRKLVVTEYDYTDPAVVELSESGMADSLDKMVVLFKKK